MAVVQRFLRKIRNNNLNRLLKIKSWYDLPILNVLIITRKNKNLKNTKKLYFLDIS